MKRSSLEFEWQAALAELGLSGAELLQARRDLPVQRVYRAGDQIIKLHLKFNSADATRSQRLGVGFETTRACQDLPGVPPALWGEDRQHVYACAYRAVEARPIH